MNTKFEPGDRVRCVETWTTHVIDRGDEFTVDDVDPTGPGPQVFVQGEWVPARYFEKVEWGWVVGQRVSGDDYIRLPIRSVVFEPAASDDTVQSVPIMKTGEDEWTNQGWPGVFSNADMAGDVRTLMQLGDGTSPRPGRDCFIEAPHIHGTIFGPGGITIDGTLIVPTAEPEDTDAEPLKEGDWVQVWAQVRDPEPDYDGEIKLRLDRLGAQTGDRLADAWARPDAIVRPDAGQVPPWVKPAQCSSLLMVDKTTNLRRCIQDERQAHTIHRDSRGTTWVTAAESGRITEGGAS